MIKNRKAIRPGVTLVDPTGRRSLVQDVFVPKNQSEKSAHLPSGFRQFGRKIIVFSSGSIMHLADAERRYSLAS
ncbi:hypothetical protein [Teredinibacter franksiae]|jgi:hypothetical protein|uniref:hypothetical protein n=1 Tax=Teredinibacter franksiae TaxID=2761453 RepID=UPI0016236BF5|nr:hypothetical protein [Teredinibacter franksiae]